MQDLRGEDLERLGIQIGKIVATKNAAYGNAFGTAGEALRLLYPDGLQPVQYDDALALVRIFDKMKRIATKKDAFGESPFVDIAGYGILGAALSAVKQGEKDAIDRLLKQLGAPHTPTTPPSAPKIARKPNRSGRVRG
jgi:hypothetical protein